MPGDAPPTPDQVREALLDDDVLPVPDGATVGSLGDDSVLLPEALWRTLQAAARDWLRIQEEAEVRWVCGNNGDTRCLNAEDAFAMNQEWNVTRPHDDCRMRRLI